LHASNAQPPSQRSFFCNHGAAIASLPRLPCLPDMATATALRRVLLLLLPAVAPQSLPMLVW
jgi:hypothetical protein